jgi:Ca-activated chloride channel family protein
MVGIVASRLTDPVLTDVRVHVDGDVKLSRMLPAQPADIFADRDLVLLTRYTGHGPARVIVEGRRGVVPVRWETLVDFPARQRDNPFVARLWATQRVGFLSADKRRNGGSPELDDEIRLLGERYGIPTEFTSYLVVEPRFSNMATTGAVAPMTAAVPAPAAQRELRFESAKAAAAQRAVLNLAAADSMRAASSTSMRRVDGRVFTLADGRWIDQRYTSSMETMRIKPFSNAYFQLLVQLPELRPMFALGPRVVVAGRTRAIELTEDGTVDLTRSALEALLRAW